MIIANKKIAPHPGEVPELILKENNLTQTKLALHLDIPQTKISEMVCKKRGLSAEMSMKLEKALGMKINSLDEFAEKLGACPSGFRQNSARKENQTYRKRGFGSLTPQSS